MIFSKLAKGSEKCSEKKIKIKKELKILRKGKLKFGALKG